VIGIGGRNVDFRWATGTQGNPGIDKLLRDGTQVVRVISLPAQEAGSSECLAHGIRVLAVYTGESDAGRYVLKNASALQIGNEPQYAYPTGAASWPTGTADDMVNVWSDVANVLVGSRELPLIGPAFWSQDYAQWAKVAPYLGKLSAAAVHCYPKPSLQTVASMKAALKAYAAVRPDLPLICTEWTSHENVLAYARAIDTYCEARLWYGPAGDYHRLEGTPEYGILALAR
jgi:hypothetical protein